MPKNKNASVTGNNQVTTTTSSGASAPATTKVTLVCKLVNYEFARREQGRAYDTIGKCQEAFDEAFNSAPVEVKDYWKAARARRDAIKSWKNAQATKSANEQKLYEAKNKATDAAAALYNKLGIAGKTAYNDLLSLKEEIRKSANKPALIKGQDRCAFVCRDTEQKFNVYADDYALSVDNLYKKFTVEAEQDSNNKIVKVLSIAIK